MSQYKITDYHILHWYQESDKHYQHIYHENEWIHLSDFLDLYYKEINKQLSISNKE